VGPAVATTEVEEDVDGKPLGVLQEAPVASTTDVEENFDDRPPGGHCQRVQQWPPRLKKTSMVGPWGALPLGLAAATEVEEDVDGGPLGGVAGGSGSVHHRC
jgi:hypothetical protein